MGLGGFIVSGAVGGAGQGANGYFDTQQKLQGQYANEANLAQLNAQLDAVKQYNALALQRNFRNAQLDDLENRANAWDAAHGQPQATPATPAAAQAQNPTATPIAQAAGDAASEQGLQGAALMPPPTQDRASWNIPSDQQKRADMGALQEIQAEMQTEKDPQNLAAMQRESNRIQAKYSMTNEGAGVGQLPSSQGGQAAPPKPAMSMPQAVTNPYRALIPAIQAETYLQGAGIKKYESTLPNTDVEKLLVARQKYQDGSPQANAIDEQLRKINYIAPTSIRGNYMTPDGKIHMMPVNAPPGFINQQNSDGSWSVVPMQNGTDAVAAEESAHLRGKNDQTLAPTDLQPRNPDGTIKPATVSQVINAANSGYGASVGLAPGQETAAETSQKDLAAKWGKLNDANSGAQTTLSYLQNIKSLAAKTQTGQFADRLQYINSLLSLVGDSKATDEASARNLLDKYKGQIVAKLGGSGGMSTDAGRAIIDSAYPGAHMTNAAINEAVDNLAGAMNMTKAKATFLQPYYANKDANAYQQNETAFDQNADPRIWQWQAIQDPRQRAAFAQSLMRQDPTIGQKIHNLESIGAIK